MVRVLVVDDEQMIRWCIEQTLGAVGYDVVGAATVAEGMSLLRQVRPDVVFLDVRLPDADGLDILRSVSQQGDCKTAVVVMTAYEDACTAAEAVRLGAVGYLKKPFDFDQLEKVTARAAAAAGANGKVEPLGNS